MRLVVLLLAAGTILMSCEAGYALNIHNEMAEPVIVALAWEESTPETYRVPAHSRRMTPPLVGPFIGRVLVLDNACRQLAEFPTSRVEGRQQLVIRGPANITLGAGVIEQVEMLGSNPLCTEQLSTEP